MNNGGNSSAMRLLEAIEELCGYHKRRENAEGGILNESNGYIPINPNKEGDGNGVWGSVESSMFASIEMMNLLKQTNSELADGWESTYKFFGRLLSAIGDVMSSVETEIINFSKETIQGENEAIAASESAANKAEELISQLGNK